VSPGAANIAVSILHTGEHYPDDLSEEGLIYHYPETRRPPGRDRSEIDATKAAAELKLPIFVILSEPSDPTLRRVRLGWVADWDDASKQFLVLFGDERPTYQHSALADQPFQLHRPRERKVVQSLARWNPPLSHPPCCVRSWIVFHRPGHSQSRDSGGAEPITTMPH
jgi:hypothetical protein